MSLQCPLGGATGGAVVANPGRLLSVGFLFVLAECISFCP